MKGLLTALRTLTTLRLPPRADEDLASSLPWFPVAGLLLGLMLSAAAGIWGALAPDWPKAGGMLLVAAGVLLTGGLHLDGLADWADALGASRDREVRLAVMKDPRVGSFGVIALFLIIAAKWTALERILEAGSAAYIPLALIASRWLMAELSCKLPSARAGIGTAAPFILGATRARRITAGGLGLGLCLPWGLIGAGFFGLAWAAGLIWSGHCKRGFGGITGDLLGACGEIVEVVLLFVICFLPTEPVLWYTIPGLW